MASLTNRLLAGVLVGGLASPLLAQFDGFWELRPSLNIARQEVGVAALGGKLYVAGGLLSNRQGSGSVEVYDPKTARWGRIADMPLALHHHGLCAAGGKLYQIGGYPGRGFSPTRQCQVWDPATNKWSRIADLPRARGGSVAVTIGNKIYIAGGVEQGEGVSNTLAIYDTSTNKWSSGARMRFRREHLSAAALLGKLHVIGGRSPTNNALHESYDPSTNKWTTLPSMPTARGGNAAAALHGKLIVVGGEAFRPSRVFPQTEEYDPKTNKWRALRNMRIPVHGIQMAAIGDELLVPGGGLVAGYSTTKSVTALRYLPTGVSRYGQSTPACRGPISLSVLASPVGGRNDFGFASDATAPANSVGILALSASGDRRGTKILGVNVYFGLPPVLLLPASTSGNGSWRLSLPLPASARGVRVYAQCVYATTAACNNGGPLASSDALDVIVR